ncbi:hypothetical protein MB90_004263 [Salmonella enterica subsp. enterica]|nr:hypothetical protein [Salmonella enterica]ECB3971056.1 hypothetical protein [Salmonella enterica subsp. enterica serovar Lexington]ECC3316297.1 hypothetical protein [Salmonella enterica subsp. enterica]EDW0191076.1 hypothetical protein [Salmonella enterica subsp. enterica serovar Orion]EDR9117743.1 hypothetical protein [Salmonella enterica subsp. enterica]
MKICSVIYLCTTIFLLSACVRSPIDAKKKDISRTESSISKNTASQLTDKDIFGNETTLAVSEEDIQAALEGEKFSVPLNSAVILVQSGNRAPEAIMQQEMSKYYTVSTFSGIPDRQKTVTCSKDKIKDGNQDIATAENMNWMQALRYVAAKGHQKAIIVYQDTLQSGKYDAMTKNTVWSDFKNEKLTDSVSLRYLVRFTLVDVATGEWATWSPLNFENTVLPPQPGKKDSAEATTEQQISQLRQRTYASMVKDLVNRYQ